MVWSHPRPDWPLSLCDDQQGQALAYRLQKIARRGAGASDTNFAGASLGSLVGFTSCFLLVEEKDVGKLLGHSHDAFPLALPGIKMTKHDDAWKGLCLDMGRKSYGRVTAVLSRHIHGKRRRRRRRRKGRIWWRGKSPFLYGSKQSHRCVCV